ncbi:hypothetical protein Bsph_2394 [Lysinibacillus sphaericus C3-41]|uniref:Uncharacterized protein n=3 Tax=Bacillaceae TaxID=186817 RepID=B1HWW2_LYSSC|nr:hypothetical protein Bsph_2394 [Lysinibacillus sphaericus C3-41]
MIMQPFQGKRIDKMVMSINSLDVRPPVLIFLRYQQLRC